MASRWLAIHDVACRPDGSQTCQTCAYNYACLDGVSVSQVLALAERALATAHAERERRLPASRFARNRIECIEDEAPR